MRPAGIKLVMGYKNQMSVISFFEVFWLHGAGRREGRKEGGVEKTFKTFQTSRDFFFFYHLKLLLFVYQWNEVCDLNARV